MKKLNLLLLLVVSIFYTACGGEHHSYNVSSAKENTTLDSQKDTNKSDKPSIENSKDKDISSDKKEESKPAEPINQDENDIIHLDKSYYKIDYSKKYKGAVKVSYTLDGNKVNGGNIEQRPKFFTDTELPKKYATTPNDYNNTGLDRGHLAPDASFDYTKKAQLSTYTMANIVPQYPLVNREVWKDIEVLERYNASQFGTIKITNIVDYKGAKIFTKIPSEEIAKLKEKNNKNYFKNVQHRANYVKNREKERIDLEKKKIYQPVGFTKIMENDSYKFKECYYVPNIPFLKSLKIKDYKIKCPK